jgi:hypothetical protein
MIQSLLVSRMSALFWFYFLDLELLLCVFIACVFRFVSLMAQLIVLGSGFILFEKFRFLPQLDLLALYKIRIVLENFEVF